MLYGSQECPKKLSPVKSESPHSVPYSPTVLNYNTSINYPYRLSVDPKMSRIQELPDDYNSSNPLPPSTETPFPISTKSKAQNASSATAPSLPPAMDSVRSHTADEIVQMMKRTPLFMTNLDEATGAEGEGTDHLVLTISILHPGAAFPLQSSMITYNGSSTSCNFHELTSLAL